MVEQPKPSLVERVYNDAQAKYIVPGRPAGRNYTALTRPVVATVLRELAAALRERAQQQYDRWPKTSESEIWLAAELSQADWLDREAQR